MPVLSRMAASGRARLILTETDDFAVDYSRIHVTDENVFKRDPVNLIRVFHLAQKYNLAFHPDAMHVATLAKLIDQKLREDEEANRLFLDLTSNNDAETVLRRMNEAGVLGRFMPAFGRIVAMMVQHVPPLHRGRHLLRASASSRHRGRPQGRKFANELIRTSSRGTASCSMSRCSCTTSPRAGSRTIRSPARGSRNPRPRFVSPAETETVVQLVEALVMSSVARRAIQRPHDDQNQPGGAPVEAKLLHPHRRRYRRSGRAERLEGTAHPRSVRDRAVLTAARGQPRAGVAVAGRFRESRIDSGGARRLCRLHYPAYWLKVDLPQKSPMRASRTPQPEVAATSVTFPAARGVTEPPWSRRITLGCSRSSPAPARCRLIRRCAIFTTDGGRAIAGRARSI
jgi:[protein-PII] uridylyltransferase